MTAENWRWSQWEMLWLSGPVWLIMFFALPETSTGNILLRRAKRLRLKTGDQRLKSQSEIDSANIKLGATIKENLLRPNQIMLQDPAVAFTALYTALVYGIYYSFFEAFPLVYIKQYGFNLGEMGLTFLSITIGVVIAIAIYWAYNYYKVEPEIRAHGLGPPERRLIPALVASFFCPIGLFMFGWTGRESIHWIVSVLGIMIFTIGIFIILQCIFLYVSLSPAYNPIIGQKLTVNRTAPAHLSTIRRLPLRWQRLHPLHPRLRCHPLFAPALRQPRRRPRVQLARRFDGRLHFWCVLFVLPGPQTKSAFALLG